MRAERAARRRHQHPHARTRRHPLSHAGVYQEIVEPERLVFTSAALDGEDNPLFEVLNTVTLAEQGGKTTLTLQARVVETMPEAAAYLKGMEEGWSQSLERLAEHLAKVLR